MSNDDRFMDPFRPFTEEVRELVLSNIVCRKYPGNVPPELPHIRGLLHQYGLTDNITAEEVLKHWHYLKMLNSAAWGVLEYMRRNNRSFKGPEPTQPEVEDAIEAFLADQEKRFSAFDAEKSIADYREVRTHVDGIPPDDEMVAVYINNRLQSNAAGVHKTLHVTPADVIAAWKMGKEYGYDF